ncbi:MAG: hypothetical protein PHN60_00690 [Candidatus Gracilibacteria bacterium]|nr:hypothetical protein [Candidatus Gracilibacteria bacterium]
MKQFHALMTNTTSLVGYIAVLMFVGAYLGGNKSYTFDPILLKGSVMESGGAIKHDPLRSMVITIDGRQYEVQINREIIRQPEFQY